jgi:hypothetical protein
MPAHQGSTSKESVRVNRAPVLTLWAAVVAERLGYTPEEALSLGKAVAGLFAQFKGRHLGLWQPQPKPAETSASKPEEQPTVELLSRPIPVARTRQGVRAMVKGQPISPASVKNYLKRAFGDKLSTARQAMEDLAAAYAPEELDQAAYDLYEQFRPRVEPGIQGWGAKGELDLDHIRSLGTG